MTKERISHFVTKKIAITKYNSTTISSSNTNENSTEETQKNRINISKVDLVKKSKALRKLDIYKQEVRSTQQSHLLKDQKRIISVAF